MAANRLITPKMRNALCIASMKSCMLRLPEGGATPANIAWSALSGTEALKITKTSPRLTRDPTLKRVDETAEATPRLTGGTEFMIAATFGAKNIPPPAPARIMGRARVKYGTSNGSVENQKRAIAERMSPVGARACPELVREGATERADYDEGHREREEEEACLEGVVEQGALEVEDQD